jgi:lipoprotein-anchoring transpeptidase ErfK/SrfK
MFRVLLRPVLALALAGPLAHGTRAQETAGEPAPSFAIRPVQNWLEAQIELHRRGFSCGSIDGVGGAQSAAALRAFQRSAYLEETGQLDRPTRESLLLTEPALTTHTITAEELASLQPVPDTWLGKSERDRLGFATALELVAEKYRANPRFLQRLNPGVNWDDLLPGTVVQVPDVWEFRPPSHAAQLHVRLADRVLQAYDAEGRLIAHFPVSIARAMDKRPIGELRVIVVIENPNYTFDPAVFTESEEGRTLGRRLIIPPGPNNPVGVAWVGLNRPGYGIHGTPEPEKVGRTESHGCFRLANWDARALLRMAWEGLPVLVDP